MAVVSSLTPEDLWSEAYRHDPVPVWRRLRDDEPVFRDTIGDCWVLSRYDDVAAVFADHETYSIETYAGSTGEVLGPTLIQMDGPEHVWRRSVVAKDFVGRRLEEFAPVLDRAVDDLVARFPADGPVDLVRQFSTYLPVNVIVAMLGTRGDETTFHGWVKDIMAGLAPLPEQRTAGRAAFGGLCRHIAPLFDGVDDDDRRDLIAKIARAESGGRSLDPAEQRAFIGLLFIAGGETTDKAIGNLWWNLLSHPGALAAVQADPDLLDAAFSETMRRDAPVCTEDRLTRTEVTWHGRTIPPGQRVRVLLAAANRDPDVFDSPDEFRLDRDDLHLGVERRYGGADDDGRASHLGFGLGKHFCLGYQLARMEAVRGSQRLLEEWPAPRLADPDQAGPVLARSMRSLASLPVETGRTVR